MRAEFRGGFAERLEEIGTNAGVGVAYGRQHFLYFFPLPQGQGSLRPTLPALDNGAT